MRCAELLNRCLTSNYEHTEPASFRNRFAPRVHRLSGVPLWFVFVVREQVAPMKCQIRHTYLPVLLLFGYFLSFAVFGGACSWNPLASQSVSRIVGDQHLASLEQNNYTFQANPGPQFCISILSGKPRTFRYLEATLAALLKHASPIYDLRIFIETDLALHKGASRAAHLGIPVTRLTANVCRF